MHFNVTILVAAVCLGYLHGSNFNVNSRRPRYQEVDGSVVHATSYALLQSDITTAVSLAATITRVAGGWWPTGYIWRCIFVAMERGGISARGLSQAISNRPPAPRQFTRKSSMVIIYITLFATFAIDYFSAALTGSFIWEAAVTLVPGKIPLSGIRNGTVDYAGQAASDSYLPITFTDEISPFTSTNVVDYNSEIITMASASASIAWGTPKSNSTLEITKPCTTFRRVINGAQYISTYSTLANVPMPYFAVDAFEWVRDPHQVLKGGQLSLLHQNASGYNPFAIRKNGTGGLLPDGDWGYVPQAGNPLRPISETRLFAFRISIPPSTDPSAAAPPCPQNYTIDPGSVINFISGQEDYYASGKDCFAIANVSYRAGVISQTSTLVSPNVVESEVSYESSIMGNAVTPGALALAPLIAANFLLLNYAVPFNYGTRRNLGIELTSRAYQAAWAAMVDLTTTSANPTTVQIALPTLSAKIIYWRVYLWIALHLWVLVLGLLFTYVQSHCDHPWVDDPTMAVFCLDTRAALQPVSDPWQPETEIQEDGMLILELDEAGQRSVQVKRDCGSHQRRCSGSIPLQRRIPLSSTIPEEENRESVETLIGISVPTTLHTSSSDSTKTPASSAE